MRLLRIYKSPMILLLMLLLVLPGPVFGQTGTYDWSGTAELYPGIKHVEISTNSPRSMVVDALQIDTTTPELTFHTTERCNPWVLGVTETLRKTTRNFIRESQATSAEVIVAMNADAWEPFNSGEWNLETQTDPLGFAVSDGIVVSHGSGAPSLIFDSNGTASMAGTWFGYELSHDVRTAVSGFNFCLSDGVPIPSAGDTHPRTGTGLSQDSRYVYFMTIDGRQPASDGATIQEVGSWLKYFGAYDGINMDGGGSTTMAWWDPSAPGSDKATLLNSPRGAGGWSIFNSERAVGNNIGVYYAAPTTSSTSTSSTSSTTTTSTTSTTSTTTTSTTSTTSTTTTSTTSTTLPITAGLVLHYAFDSDEAGMASDQTGNGHTGTVFGAAWVDNEPCGGAYDFDGVNDYISAEDSAMISFGNGFQDSPFSVSVLVRMDDATRFRIISKGEFHEEWTLSTGGNDQFTFQVSDNGIYNRRFWNSPDGFATLFEGSWTHVVATYDGQASSNSHRMYVNGIDIAMNAGSAGNYVAMPATQSTLRVGKADENYANGMIDEVRIYNRELKQIDVDKLFTTTSSSTTSTTTSTTTSVSTDTSTSTSSTTTTFAPPVIVDMDAATTLWAVYAPTGITTPMYSTNLETMPIEWIPISVYSNTLVNGTHVFEFDRPDTNASVIYFELLQTL